MQIFAIKSGPPKVYFDLDVTSSTTIKEVKEQLDLKMGNKKKDSYELEFRMPTNYTLTEAENAEVIPSTHPDAGKKVILQDKCELWEYNIRMEDSLYIVMKN